MCHLMQTAPDSRVAANFPCQQQAPWACSNLIHYRLQMLRHGLPCCCRWAHRSLTSTFSGGIVAHMVGPVCQQGHSSRSTHALAGRQHNLKVSLQAAEHQRMLWSLGMLCSKLFSCCTASLHAVAVGRHAFTGATSRAQLVAPIRAPPWSLLSSHKQLLHPTQPAALLSAC